jgi:hypothetical protein
VGDARGAPLLAVDRKRKAAAQALESAFSQGGGVAYPVRDQTFGAVSGDGVARGSLYKLRAKFD